MRRTNRGVAVCGTSGTVLLTDGEVARNDRLMYDDVRAAASAMKQTHRAALWEKLAISAFKPSGLPKLMWLFAGAAVSKRYLSHQAISSPAGWPEHDCPRYQQCLENGLRHATQRWTRCHGAAGIRHECCRSCVDRAPHWRVGAAGAAIQVFRSAPRSSRDDGRLCLTADSGAMSTEAGTACSHDAHLKDKQRVAAGSGRSRLFAQSPTVNGCPVSVGFRCRRTDTFSSQRRP